MFYLGLLSLLLVSLSLAMDAFSVAVTDGIVIKNLKFRNALKIGLFFGVFQAAMPCIGWLLGYGFIRYISAIDHWIAFGLLALIGTNMIIEAVRGEEKEDSGKNPLDNKVLAVLAVATSIDALAVGITFATVGAYINIFVSSAVIGVVAFVCSVCGVYIGRKSGDLFGGKAELAGGLVLIGIGAKILIEHLFF